MVIFSQGKQLPEEEKWETLAPNQQLSRNELPGYMVVVGKHCTFWLIAV